MVGSGETAVIDGAALLPTLIYATLATALAADHVQGPPPTPDLNRMLPRGVRLEADAYGLELSDDDLECVWEVFRSAKIKRHFSEHVVVVARDEDGEIIGAITGADEISIAVEPNWQGQNIGTEMVKALLAAGGGGFMVAGTEAGAGFISALPGRLGGFPEELDVPSWEDLRQQWQEEER